MATPEPANASVTLEANIRYVPCPLCRKLMNRVNFARCSHVVVDVCGQHGTWLDKDELRRIVEFIRGGGMERARTRELVELEEQRRRLLAAKWGAGGEMADGAGGSRLRDRWLGISLVADVVESLLD
jgi:Zn-finger nucleic acid-binding protein